MSKKIHYGNFYVVFVFFGAWGKDIWPFVGKFFGELIKLHSESRCHFFYEKHFVCERSMLVLAVSDIERLSFGPLSKTFRRDLDNCFQCVQKTLFTKDILFEKKWFDVFFRPWFECFGVLSKICRRGCEKCFLRAHKNIFFKKFFWKIYFFTFHFGTVSDDFLAFRRKIFRRGVRTAS